MSSGLLDVLRAAGHERATVLEVGVEIRRALQRRGERFDDGHVLVRLHFIERLKRQ